MHLNRNYICILHAWCNFCMCTHVHIHIHTLLSSLLWEGAHKHFEYVSALTLGPRNLLEFECETSVLCDWLFLGWCLLAPDSAQTTDQSPTWRSTELFGGICAYMEEGLLKGTWKTQRQLHRQKVCPSMDNIQKKYKPEILSNCSPDCTCNLGERRAGWLC